MKKILAVWRKNKSMFSFDSDKNFIYSSRFNQFGKLRSKSKVCHSYLEVVDK